MSKLIDVSTVITKGTTPSTVGGEFVSEGINFVKSESIGQNKYLDSTLYEHITQETNNILNRSKLMEGDLLFSIAGAYLGKLAIVRKEDLPANTNQAVGIVRVNSSKMNVDYLYYYFSQKCINEYINKLSSQSGQPNLNLELLGNLEFTDRPLDEQLKIANVLSFIDKKILNNNKIISELESMAKTIYDYWFLQFEFPNEDGKPYKSSGGKMVWNNELKREIPEGWKVNHISDYVDVITGKEDANFATSNGKYAFFTCSDDILKCDIPKFKGKAILVAGNGNFNVKYYEGEFNAYQRTYVLIPKDEKYAGLMYYNVSQSINLLTKSAVGSIVKFITKGDVNNIVMVDGNKDNLLKPFNQIVSQIQYLQNENQELASLRDFLLPMLMNGQVTFKEDE